MNGWSRWVTAPSAPIRTMPSVPSARATATTEPSGQEPVRADPEHPGGLAQLGVHRREVAARAVGAVRAVERVQVPPLGLVRDRVQDARRAPARLDDGDPRSAGDRPRLAQRPIGRHVGDPQPGRVPRHVGEVPLDPGEAAAVRRGTWRRDEVGTRDEDAAGAVRSVERDRDQLVDDQQRVVLARRVVGLADGVQPLSDGVEAQVGVAPRAGRGDRDRLGRASG